MIDRKNVCPECGYHILARKDDRIICLKPGGCDWSVESKRESDVELRTYAEIRREFT